MIMCPRNSSQQSESVFFMSFSCLTLVHAAVQSSEMCTRNIADLTLRQHVSANCSFLSLLFDSFVFNYCFVLIGYFCSCCNTLDNLHKHVNVTHTHAQVAV